jgi:hypothetical protein
MSFWLNSWNSLVVAAGRRCVRGAAANHARASASRSRRLGERRLLGRLGVQLAVQKGGGEVVRLGRLELRSVGKETKTGEEQNRMGVGVPVQKADNQYTRL